MNLNVIKSFKYIIESKNDRFLFVEYGFYKKWGMVLDFLVSINKDYKPCRIYRREYKLYKNIVIIGLRWYGKNVRRRTYGYAKTLINLNHKSFCIYCGDLLNSKNATIDHIIPLSKGGNNSKVNMVVSCKKCNSEREDMEFNEYARIKNGRSGIIWI